MAKYETLPITALRKKIISIFESETRVPFYIEHREIGTVFSRIFDIVLQEECLLF